MKFISLILILSLFFWFVKPTKTFAMMDVCKKSCCKSSKPNSSEKSDKNTCCNKLTCHCFQIYSVHLQGNELPLTKFFYLNRDNHYSLYDEGKIISYSSDCFQPPEVTDYQIEFYKNI